MIVTQTCSDGLRTCSGLSRQDVEVMELGSADVGMGYSNLSTGPGADLLQAKKFLLL